MGVPAYKWFKRGAREEVFGEAWSTDEWTEMRRVKRRFSTSGRPSDTANWWLDRDEQISPALGSHELALEFGEELWEVELEGGVRRRQAFSSARPTGLSGRRGRLVRRIDAWDLRGESIAEEWSRQARRELAELRHRAEAGGDLGDLTRQGLSRVEQLSQMLEDVPATAPAYRRASAAAMLRGEIAYVGAIVEMAIASGGQLREIPDAVLLASAMLNTDHPLGETSYAAATARARKERELSVDLVEQLGLDPDRAALDTVRVRRPLPTLAKFLGSIAASTGLILVLVCLVPLISTGSWEGVEDAIELDEESATQMLTLGIGLCAAAVLIVLGLRAFRAARWRRRATELYG